jgi:dUTP pyrophosphatase
MTSSVDRAPATAMVLIQVKLLREGAQLPHRGSDLATGFDLHACLDAPVTLGEVPVVVPTGVAIAVPPGWDAQVRPRSGLARRGVLSTFGTIDADYRGELMVTMYTTSPAIRYTVHDGDRIAQLVVSRVAVPQFVPVDDLDDTVRGAAGHGSTGR